MRASHVYGPIILGSIVCAGNVFAQEDRAVMVKNAFDAFNARKYEEAIKIADACADQFGRAARRDQQWIEAGKERPLPAGRADPKTPAARATFANGVLNDAAACLFVLATSQERTGNCRSARETYQQLAELTHARTWDPQGWFWAPSDAASDAIERLKTKC
jgi:hypothetical protein